MTEEQIEVYGKLFDASAASMERSGSEFHYLRSTLTANVGTHPRKPDLSRMRDLDNEAFFQALFSGTYKRLPEEREEAPWRKRYGEDREVFREAVLRSFAGSSVAAIYHMEWENNPYFVQRKGLKYLLFGKLYALTDKSSLRTFGKKLPGPLQKIIRKVFL
ncbi:MAG: hypothetical protein IKS07_05685 [Lachnospiraceae bacterium]|nr:hypothetical protein [Lachnospiraceae bacterium]